MPDLPRPLWPRAECIAMRRCPDCGYHIVKQGHHENCPSASRQDGQ